MVRMSGDADVQRAADHNGAFLHDPRSPHSPRRRRSLRIIATFCWSELVAAAHHGRIALAPLPHPARAAFAIASNVTAQLHGRLPP